MHQNNNKKLYIYENIYAMRIDVYIIVSSVYE